LRRSTMRCTCPRALSRTERSMVTFIAEIPVIPDALRAPQEGRGLCQGASAGARAQPAIDGCFLQDFRRSVNFGESFTSP
jgi:hypothetical protein